MTAHPRPMPLADLRAVCADMGYSTFHLDRANAERARRICALGKARAARDAMRLARRANFERGQLLVESVSRRALQRFLGEWRAMLTTLKTPSRLRWHLEVDPLEF